MTKITTSTLKSMILDLLKKRGLTDSCYSQMLSYVVELFTKKGLGDDYYGYHNINHELAVTYVTLLASIGKKFQNFITIQDLKHLYVAALLHDFDPKKNVDKPHEEAVVKFVQKDQRLLNLLNKAKVDKNIVLGLILRTTFPWKGENKKRAKKRIDEFFSKSEIISKNSEQKAHFLKLGNLLSTCDRIGGYSLGNFLDSMDMVKKNAHALGWNPETMVKRSILYFEDLLNTDSEMTDMILHSLPIPLRKKFMNNVIKFFKLRQKEMKIRSEIIYDNLSLVATLETNHNSRNLDFIDSLFKIYQELPDPLQFSKPFVKSINNSSTILVTLRLGDNKGEIVGFAKGGPLEGYTLPKKIKDENMGLHNTVFLEPPAVKMGYWGLGGDPKMRVVFRKIAKENGFKFLTSFLHRELIQKRVEGTEKIDFVQKCNPEQLDYYRRLL